MSVGTVIRGAVRIVSGARGGMGGLPPGLRVHCRVYRTAIRESIHTRVSPEGANINGNYGKYYSKMPVKMKLARRAKT